MEERRWYEEFKRVTKEHTYSGGSFVVYKGFKVTKGLDGFYDIWDCRRSEYDLDIMPQHRAMFNTVGVILGVSTISYLKNKLIVDEIVDEIAVLYDKRTMAKNNLAVYNGSEISTDAFIEYVRINKKRGRLANKNIDILTNELFLVKERIKDYEVKYMQEVCTKISRD